MSLVTTQRCRIRGSLPARFVHKRKIKATHYGRSRIGHYPMMHMDPDHKIDDFMMYSEPDDEDEENEAASAESDGQRNSFNQQSGKGIPKTFSQRCLPVSYNVSDYILTRSLGLNRHESFQMSDEYGTRHMLTTGMFKENSISLVPPAPPPTPQDMQQPHHYRRPLIVDKVFSSQWLDNNKVIMGTKCNKIKIYDTNSRKVIDLPRLSHPPSDNAPAVTSPGVYAIEINPSRTLLATVGQAGRDVSLYRLPNLEPVCLGHKSHTDGILDLCWLDDDFIVSGGMDRQMALWRIDDYPLRSVSSGTSLDEDDDQMPPLPAVAPLRIKRCVGADKVRAVIFNRQKSEIITLSTNAFIHVWDPERFYQKMSRKLPHAMENVCLTQRQDFSLYAVGSKSHFTLLDPRTLHHVKKVSARINGCSVKSLSFHRDVLTIGTAVGAILFFDMRAGKYMESTMNSGRAVMLKCSRGYVHLEEAAMELMPNVDYSPTIYTHCYDLSGTRLFAAGGPLSVSLRGHYAGIWQ